jgi:hypothetical protein
LYELLYDIGSGRVPLMRFKFIQQICDDRAVSVPAFGFGQGTGLFSLGSALTLPLFIALHSLGS